MSRRMSLEVTGSGLKREVKLLLHAADLKARIKSAKQPSQIRSTVKVLAQEQVMKAIEKLGLKPALAPEVTVPKIEDDGGNTIKGSADLIVIAKFEIVPDIPLPDFSNIHLVKYAVKVSNKDINSAISRIAEQNPNFIKKISGAERGDKVILSFQGKIRGRAFKGGTAKEVPMLLRHGELLPDFEDQLIGMRTGEKRTVHVRFPSDYSVKQIAGEEAIFEVTVAEVQAKEEVAIGDALAKHVGLKSLSELTQRVRERIANDLEARSHELLKHNLLDALDMQCSFELPEMLVEREFRQIWASVLQELRARGSSFDDEGISQRKAELDFREIARRRVRLGLLLGSIGDRANIRISDEEMEKALLEEAQQHPGQEEEIYEMLRQDPEKLMQVRGPIFEQKVVEYILPRTRISTEFVTEEKLSKMLENT